MTSSPSESFLLDSSVLARLPRSPEVRAAVEEPLRGGRVHISGVLLLEGGYTAPNADQLDAWLNRATVFPLVEIVPSDWTAAQRTQRALAARGRHRGVGIPHLLQAAAAERAGLTVLHYDHDFDLIAEVTGQPVRWVVARGTVD